MALGRRRFLAVTVAAICVGCTSDDGDDDAAGAGDGEAGEEPVPDDEVGVEAPLPGFGEAIPIGTIAEVRQRMADEGGVLYVPEGRAWIVPFPEEAIDAATESYDAAELVGMQLGFVALYQKCTHLGCRVPFCETSKRFECPCHAAVFNGVGELVAGPAERGLDRFPIHVRDGQLIVDTEVIIEGPDPAVATVPGEPAGPTCVGVG